MATTAKKTSRRSDSDAATQTTGPDGDWLKADYPIEDRAEALLSYVFENPLDATAKPAVDALVRNIDGVKRSKPTETSAGKGDREGLLSAYYEVSMLVSAVDGPSGTSILDSNTKSAGALRSLTFLAGFLIVLAVISQVLGVWTAENSGGEGTWMSVAEWLNDFVFSVISPFIWGALGSAIYILKRVSDMVRAQKFEVRFFRGVGARIVLGAVFGGLFVTMVSDETLGDVNINLTAEVLGFLAGFGVKVLYGAFEGVVESICKKFNLGSGTTTSTNQ